MSFYCLELSPVFTFKTYLSSGVVRNEHKILGGEVCLWSEYITSETAMSVLW
jgi:hypothetical protein